MEERQTDGLADYGRHFLGILVGWYGLRVTWMGQMSAQLMRHYDKRAGMISL